MSQAFSSVTRQGNITTPYVGLAGACATYCCDQLLYNGLQRSHVAKKGYRLQSRSCLLPLSLTGGTDAVCLKHERRPSRIPHIRPGESPLCYQMAAAHSKRAGRLALERRLPLSRSGASYTVQALPDHKKGEKEPIHWPPQVWNRRTGLLWRKKGNYGAGSLVSQDRT